MIQSNYIKLFTTAVYHTYFDSNKCNCLHFIANDKTEKMLKKFGFKINTISNGFDLYSNTASSLSNLFDYISKTATQDYFEFNIKCSNPNFILFTALPINWLGEITYTSQNDKNQNNNNTVTLSQTLETKAIAPFFGNFKIYFKDILKNQNNTNSLQFEINFKARATQWQYYFINKNAISLNNPSITEKGNIQFEGPQQVTLQTGEKALLFTSNNTDILLSEKPKYKFDLINKNTSTEADQNNSNGKVIFKGLPVPDVSQIGIVANSKTNQVASPMYVYL